MMCPQVDKLNDILFIWIKDFFIESRFPSHAINPDHNFLSLHPSHSPHTSQLNQIHSLLCFFLRKYEDPQERTANQKEDIYKGTRQKSSYWGWTRQLNRKRAGKMSQEIHQLLLLGVPQKRQANSHKAYAEDLFKFHIISLMLQVKDTEWLRKT